jgi:hypothetical protein
MPSGQQPTQYRVYDALGDPFRAPIGSRIYSQTQPIGEFLTRADWTDARSGSDAIS